MEQKIIIAVLLNIIIAFLYWKLTQNFAKKAFGEMWKKWQGRFFYWHGVIFVSGGITILLIMIAQHLELFGF